MRHGGGGGVKMLPQFLFCGKLPQFLFVLRGNIASLGYYLGHFKIERYVLSYSLNLSLI